MRPKRQYCYQKASEIFKGWGYEKEDTTRWTLFSDGVLGQHAHDEPLDGYGEENG